jgi:hypothetical protein
MLFSHHISFHIFTQLAAVYSKLSSPSSYHHLLQGLSLLARSALKHKISFISAGYQPVENPVSWRIYSRYSSLITANESCLPPCKPEKGPLPGATHWASGTLSSPEAADLSLMRVPSSKLCYRAPISKPEKGPLPGATRWASGTLGSPEAADLSLMRVPSSELCYRAPISKPEKGPLPGATHWASGTLSSPEAADLSLMRVPSSELCYRAPIS